MSRMSVKLSSEMEELIEDTASREGISKGEVIRRAFALYKLAEDEKQNGRTLAVVEDKGGENIKVIAKIMGI